MEARKLLLWERFLIAGFGNSPFGWYDLGIHIPWGRQKTGRVAAPWGRQVKARIALHSLHIEVRQTEFFVAWREAPN